MGTNFDELIKNQAKCRHIKTMWRLKTTCCFLTDSIAHGIVKIKSKKYAFRMHCRFINHNATTTLY